MCLYIKKDDLFKIATSDICCYKVIIEKRNDFSDKLSYKTCYQRFPIIIGDVYTSDLVREEYSLSPIINAGLHSFKTFYAAKILRNFLKDRRCDKYLIVKCTIPVGSNYYVGYFDGCISYASDTIRFDRIVKIRE